MKQSVITITIIAISAGLLGAVVWGSQQADSPADSPQNQVEIDIDTQNKDQEASINNGQDSTEADIDYYYWGTTCPYCHDVMDWMDENQVQDKLNVVRKEVSGNQQNAAELSQRAQSCGMGEEVPIPFMYTSGGECLFSATPIIEYLEQKLEQAKNTEAAVENENDVEENGMDIEIDEPTEMEVVEQE